MKTDGKSGSENGAPLEKLRMGRLTKIANVLESMLGGSFGLPVALLLSAILATVFSMGSLKWLGRFTLLAVIIFGTPKVLISVLRYFALILDGDEHTVWFFRWFCGCAITLTLAVLPVYVMLEDLKLIFCIWFSGFSGSDGCRCWWSSCPSWPVSVWRDT